jgi:MFS family permease
MVFGWGIFYIYGVFFTPLENEFHWTRVATSGAFSIAILVCGVTNIIAGRLSDRLGPKAIIMSCGIILAAGYFLMAVVQNIWQLYLVFGFLIASGVGGFWAPPLATVARWFTNRRGLMTGIVSGGISFGTLWLPPLMTQMIAIFDWRATYIIIGGAILICVTILAQFLKAGPPSSRSDELMSLRVKTPAAQPAPGLKEAVRTRQFWMVCGVYLLFGMVQVTVMVHIVPAAGGLNITPLAAATILSIIGGASLAGRIIMGIFSDRVHVKPAALVCLALLTLSFVWLPFASRLWELDSFAVLFGFGYGGLSCLQSLIAADLYGLAALGAITAIFSFCFDVGGSIGPVVAGRIYDITQNYQWAFLICLVIITLALIVFIAVNPPRKKAAVQGERE